MSSYSLNIGGTVPVSCWIKPVDGGEYEVFCNSAGGYDIFARAPQGEERLISGGDGPVHAAFDLASLLVDGETILTIRAR